MRRDETDVVLVVLAPGNASDDLALHDNGAARVLKTQIVVCHLVFPDDVARFGRQARLNWGIARARKDLVVVDRDISVEPGLVAGWPPDSHRRVEAGV